MEKKELAQLIRKGIELPDFREVTDSFLYFNGENYCGCAQGAALCAKFGSCELAGTTYWAALNNDLSSTSSWTISELLGIDVDLVHEITHLHIFDKKSALEIADMLENGEL